MFPIKTTYTKGYVHGVLTFYGAKHRGEDYIIPVGTKIYAPFDGEAVAIKGTQGGNMIYFYTGKYVIRLLHLSSYVKLGQVKEGDLIALSGNTGLSTGPHLHLDISIRPFSLANFNNFVDPAKFVWDNSDMDAKERAQYEETIRQLNTEIGDTIVERDNAREALVEKTQQLSEVIERDKKNYSNWQECLDNYNKCKADKLSDLSLREKLLALLGY